MTEKCKCLESKLEFHPIKVYII